ncbi:MAG: hypothetical protein R3C59_17605 [Planctomycetaceae bacterium]
MRLVQKELLQPEVQVHRRPEVLERLLLEVPVRLLLELARLEEPEHLQEPELRRHRLEVPERQRAQSLLLEQELRW